MLGWLKSFSKAKKEIKTLTCAGISFQIAYFMQMLANIAKYFCNFNARIVQAWELKANKQHLSCVNQINSKLSSAPNINIV
jgi:hypothetical protein